MHRPKAADRLAEQEPGPQQGKTGHVQLSPKAAHRPRTRPTPKALERRAVCDPGPKPHRQFKRLTACQGPHLKVLVLNNSYLAPAHRALQGLLAL